MSGKSVTQKFPIQYYTVKTHNYKYLAESTRLCPHLNTIGLTPDFFTFAYTSLHWLRCEKVTNKQTRHLPLYGCMYVYMYISVSSRWTDHLAKFAEYLGYLKQTINLKNY